MKHTKRTPSILSIGLLFFYMIVAICFSNIQLAYSDWQSVLESNFDIVETFDNLQNWRGESGSFTAYDKMPKKTDGSASHWGMYYQASAPADDDWIKDHGDFKWGTTGKSLCINYGNFVQAQGYGDPDKWVASTGYDIDRTVIANSSTGFFYKVIIGGTAGGIEPIWPKILNQTVTDGTITWRCEGVTDGWGPARMGMFFGNGVTGKSGYKKIYIFHMMKFAPGFIHKNSIGDYSYVGVAKYLEVNTGFTTIDHWGNDIEYAGACSSPDPVRKEYGLNFTIFNIRGGGKSFPKTLFFMQNTQNTKHTSTCDSYENVLSDQNLNSAPYDSKYEANEWFGVEFMLDAGTMGNVDSSMEVWIYDNNGTKIGHDSRSGYQQLDTYDHYYNKIVFGGNRFGSDYKADSGDSDENRFYVDDVIIHGSRIGPTYFALSGGVVHKPSIPTKDPVMGK